MDNFHQNFSPFFDGDYPEPLPPTRSIELLRSEVSIPGPCCACKKGTGVLTCARCKAIKYCSKECQKYGNPYVQWLGGARNSWEDHKNVCNKIKKHRKETEDAIEALAQDFGGMDVLLRTPLVKEGRFKYQDPTDITRIHTANNTQEVYLLARMRLMQAYVKCGKEAMSCTAFRLAAENMLDILCLSYNNRNGRDGEHVKYTYCGWMVAGGMDQEALNYLCYFQHRQKGPLPYMDLSNDEDMDGDSYLNLLKDKKGHFDFSTSQWFHDYMLIALIKYKRLRRLLVQRRKDMASWTMFMMGTHPFVGEESAIQMFRGNSIIMGKLRDLVVGENTDFKIDQLKTQMEVILTAVNKRNPLIIPGIVDRSSIPKEPSFEEEPSDESDDEDDNEYDEHGDDIHDACWAFGNYGHAWNMSTAYPRVLEQMFLRTGKVLSDHMPHTPVDGFLQAAFDVDPTRFYGRDDDLGTRFNTIH